MRILSCVLLVLLLSLQYRLWEGNNSVFDNQALAQKIAEQELHNAELQKRNDVLFQEIEDLKSGTEAIEERARSDLGMIKSNEEFHLVIQRR
ncbi:MAG: cell division protein FtsB [Ferrimonas sp.]